MFKEKSIVRVLISRDCVLLSYLGAFDFVVYHISIKVRVHHKLHKGCPFSNLVVVKRQ